MFLCLFAQNGYVAAKADVGWRDIVQVLAVALVAVIFHKGPDLTPNFARKVMVFQEDAVFHGLVPKLRCPPAVWLRVDFHLELSRLRE